MQFRLRRYIRNGYDEPAINDAENIAAATNALVRQLNQQRKAAAGSKCQKERKAGDFRTVWLDWILRCGRLLDDLEFFGLLVFLQSLSKTRGCKLRRCKLEIFLNVFLLRHQDIECHWRIIAALSGRR